jgi:hypothetical protein
LEDVKEPQVFNGDCTSESRVQESKRFGLECSIQAAAEYIRFIIGLKISILTPSIVAFQNATCKITFSSLQLYTHPEGML